MMQSIAKSDEDEKPSLLTGKCKKLMNYVNVTEFEKVVKTFKEEF